MRILYVINSFDPGGAEHGLLTLIESGGFDGHELRVLALCRGRGPLADKFVERLGSEHVRFVSMNERLTLWASALGFFRILITSAFFQPHKLILSLKQANVVGRFAAILMPWMTCVAFEHSALYRARRLPGLYGPLLRLLSWRVNEVWADCTETLEETRCYYLPRKRACHIISLFSTSAASVSKTDYAIGPVLRLAAAGRLIPEKNVALIVDLVARLRSKGVVARLDIFGDGPEHGALLQQIRAHALQTDVCLRGYCADWIEQLTEADVFINLSEREGFCIVVGQAMSAGLPVIAVDVGGIRDYGRDGENMLKLVAVNLDLACNLVQCLREDASLRERLGQQARTDMLRHYDATACKNRLKAALIADGDQNHHQSLK